MCADGGPVSRYGGNNHSCRAGNASDENNMDCKYLVDLFHPGSIKILISTACPLYLYTSMFLIRVHTSRWNVV